MTQDIIWILGQSVLREGENYEIIDEDVLAETFHEEGDTFSILNEEQSTFVKITLIKYFIWILVIIYLFKNQ